MASQLMALEGRKLSALQTQEASYQAKVSAFGQVKSAFSTFQSAVSSLSTMQQFQASSVVFKPVDVKRSASPFFATIRRL